MSDRDASSDLVQLGRPARPGGSRAATAGQVYLETYGCQMNVADSNLLTCLLSDAGYARTDDPARADAIILNTCAIRERAEDRVLARARELGSHKKRRKVVLAITGCMAEHLRQQLAERAPHVDVIAGPDSYRRIADLIAEARERTRREPPVVDLKPDPSETYEGLSAIGGNGVSGFVTIQRGCDKFCTFCVVPFTRGRERGVAPAEVLRQVQMFAEAGYREVVLLGQTVNSYRWQETSFARLLRSVAEVPGVARVRFTSPHPLDFTDELIATIAEVPEVCSYIHLPVQAGSDTVLERMKRGYTVDEFRALVGRLRQTIPNLALSTDILSGFCGETEDDHRRTLALMDELRFDFAFMFSYSERQMTAASKRLVDDVAPEVKNQRLREVIETQERISAEVFSAQVGRCEQVLLHDTSRRNPEQLVGRTDGFKSVVIDRGDLRPGDLVDVQIERATMATLFGTAVAGPSKTTGRAQNPGHVAGDSPAGEQAEMP